MNLFDAATPEEQRRRNQKKDGSVVKIMERLSKLVEPTETVYGLDIVMRKQRHIDDLEDNSSLIEGETPVPKSKSRAKRKVLAPISANAPRLATHKVRVVRARSPRRVRAKGGRPDQVRIRGSSVRPRHALQYSPTDEETAEFQHAVRNIHLRKRLSPISVFNDESAAYQSRLPPFLGQHVPVNHSYNPIHQGLNFPHYPWIQPQNQNPLQMQNPYNYRPVYPIYPVAHDFGVGKENMIPAAGHLHYPANPLMFGSEAPLAAEIQSSDSTYSSFSGHFGSSGLPDPFWHAKNPLVDAFPHFSTPQEDIPRDYEDKVVSHPSSECTSQEPTAVAFTGE